MIIICHFKLYNCVQVLYSHSHNDINNNSTYTYAKTQADSLLFRYELFINFWLRFFDTKRERDTILTILTIPNIRHISWSNLNFSPSWSDLTSHHHGRTPTSHHYGRAPTSQHHYRTPTSTVCLWGRQPNCLLTFSKVNSQLTWFFKSSILRTIASGHDVIHTPASFPIWGLSWQLWLPYPLRTSVKLYPMLCSWTKSRIV